MKSRRSNWVGGIGTMGLAVGFLVLAGFAVGTAPSDAQAGPLAEFQGGNAVGLSARFTILDSFNKEAALDNETGLVWELSPGKDPVDWAGAQEHCLNLAAGGRKGWRIPSVHELASLVDPAVASPGPTLRAGHPFTNVQSANYWGAPPNPQYAAPPWYVFFSNGRTKLADQKTGKARTWCVRTAGVDISEQ